MSGAAMAMPPDPSKAFKVTRISLKKAINVNIIINVTLNVTTHCKTSVSFFLLFLVKPNHNFNIF